MPNITIGSIYMDMQAEFTQNAYDLCLLNVTQ